MPFQLIDCLAAGVTDSSGNPVENGLVTVYQAGTTTLETIYQDYEGALSHSNPATLDAAGRLVAWSDTRIKLVITSSTGAVIRTIDDVNLADSDLGVTVDVSTLAGDGLTVVGSTLSVNTDGTTITTSSDQVKLASYGARGLYAGKVTTASKTTTYTATTADDIVICDATSGAFTVTLPVAASSQYKVLTIKKTDSSSNAVTVDGDSTDTIDSGLSRLLLRQHNYITVSCNGTAWYVIAEGGLGYTISAGSSTVTQTGTVEADVVSVSFTASGTRPVVAKLVCDASGTGAYLGATYSVASAHIATSAEFFLKRGTTTIGRVKVGIEHASTSSTTAVYSPVLFESEPEIPTAGTYTYKLTLAGGAANNTANVRDVKIMVRELIA